MDELIELLADLVVEEINHADDYNNAQHQQVLGLSINSFINIYYHFGRRKYDETSNRLLTTEHYKATILSSTKQTIEALAKNIIFNTLPFIAISNQDALISGTVTNKLLN